ncbi:MAG: arylsulfatase [Proteobacteria bacterium]|nr:arylsulfatase [Pseudomonadota bacterium]
MKSCVLDQDRRVARSADLRSGAIQIPAASRRVGDRRSTHAAGSLHFRWLLVCLLALGVSNTIATTASKPNILLILADDLGWSDLGCYGGEIRTPNLDALAANGLRFTQFYNCTRCCPSRASLLTGLYPHQTGIGLMSSDRPRQPPGVADRDEAFPGYRGALNERCVTIAQVLKPAGYRTGALGKWHVGDRILPTTRGFDEFYGFVSGYAVDSWEPRMMTRLPEGHPERRYGPGEFFATDAITDHALDFLTGFRKGGDAPWFLYVAYQAPHFPLQSKPADMAGYPEIYTQGWDKLREQRLVRQKQLGLVPESTRLTARSKIPHPVASKRIGSMTDDGNNPAWDSLPADRRSDLAQRMAVYAGMVTGMDRNIGRLIADLRTHGELDRTLIVFLSDNGACAEWEPFGFDLSATNAPVRGAGINLGTQAAPNHLRRGEELQKIGGPGTFIGYGSGWANVCNTPWRLYKHYGHEGGIGTPLIAHWPERVKPKGGLRPQVGHLVDLMATCVEVGGAKYPAELDGSKILPPEGKSLLPAFANQPLTRDFLAWEHEGNRALREGTWKLVAVAGQPWELYDLSRDRTEMNDLASSEPERVRTMAAKWDEWARRTNVLPRPAEGAKKK